MMYQVILLAAILISCNAAVPRASKYHTEEKEIVYPPVPYNFEYNNDDGNGSMQFREERGDGNGKVQGRYGYKDLNGIERIVEYVADEYGYRAQIKTNEPGTVNMSPAAVQFFANPIKIAYQPQEHRASFYKESQRLSQRQRQSSVTFLQHSTEKTEEGTTAASEEAITEKPQSQEAPAVHQPQFLALQQPRQFFGLRQPVLAVRQPQPVLTIPQPLLVRQPQPVLIAPQPVLTVHRQPSFFAHRQIVKEDAKVESRNPVQQFAFTQRHFHPATATHQHVGFSSESKPQQFEARRSNQFFTLGSQS